jgi:hypothetical protein
MPSADSNLDFSILKELRKPSNQGRKVVNLIGRKFERVTPLGFLGIRDRFGAQWLCRCDCGTIWIVTAAKLLRVKEPTKSCGCLNAEQVRTRSTTHGMSRTAAYQRWSGMINRCDNPKFKQYADWGGRGITVCQGFRDFPVLYAALGDPPAGHEVNRINNDGNYSCGACSQCLEHGWPMNVKWSSKTEQARNTRANTYHTINGETFCTAEWAERCGIKKHIVYARLQSGWSIEEALELIQRTRFLGVYTVYLTANGETHALPDWAKLRGLTKKAISSRLRRGWTHEQALGFQSPPPRSRWSKRAY